MEFRYRYDTETGLYYLQSRYYNPDWGRFINADGITGETGTLLSHNMFIYCFNNPVNMQDDGGYFPHWLKTVLNAASDAATFATGFALMGTPLAALGAVLMVHAATNAAGMISDKLNVEKDLFDVALGNRTGDLVYNIYDVGLNSLSIGMSAIDIAKGGLKAVDAYEVISVGKYASAKAVSKSVSTAKVVTQTTSNGLSIYSTANDIRSSRTPKPQATRSTSTNQNYQVGHGGRMLMY